MLEIWNNLVDKFILCFVEDNRWLYMVRGLGVTLEVTALSQPCVPSTTSSVTSLPAWAALWSRLPTGSASFI